MAVVRNAAEGHLAAARGATILQLRHPNLTIRQLEEEAYQLVSKSPLPVIINSRADIALATRAAGVHLPSLELGADQLHPLAPNLLIGKSAHSLAECIAAASQGANYIIFGPIFSTPSHPGVQGLGIEQLTAAVRAVGVPVVAIGGINETRARECLSAGAAGFAAIRHFLPAAL
ncbi:MAG: thiamine phosphate synthase [Candidatus Dormibacteraceae bacterium]